MVNQDKGTYYIARTEEGIAQSWEDIDNDDERGEDGEGWEGSITYIVEFVK